MAEQVGGMVLEKLVEKLVDPIIRQFSYMFCYKSNIKTLEEKIQDIQNTKSDVTRQVDQAKRNLEIIGSEVEAWLVKVEDIGRTTDKILQGTDKVTNGCLNGWCPNLKQRYLLSRKAVKQTVIVKELRSEVGKHTKLSYLAPPPCMEEFPSTAGADVFESRVKKTQEVFEALKDTSLMKIGICGLPGIGKTKMANDVLVRVKVENLFDEVAMAVVSQSLDKKKIQDQLASMLGLELDANNSTEYRGRRLCKRLQPQGKRILVILDDLWEQLDLDEIGIPVGGQGHSMGCKVLITTRDVHVCEAMDTHKNITLQILSSDEAWDLFKQKAGDCVVNAGLNPTARNVLNECGGLPLAIVTVASALKGFENHVWIDALQQLKTCCVSRIEGMDAKVYKSLKLSYDYLKIKYGGTTENEYNPQQRLFLLCCLFPEDCDISVELLFRFAMGLGFINNQNLESARPGIQTLTDQLIKCYLLLPSDKGGHVKIHDVLRDFGLREASGSYFSRHDLQLIEWPLNDEVEHHTAISIGSREDVKLPLGLDCPHLQLLQLSCPGSIQISKDYFGAMKQLRVVFLEKKSISFPVLKSSPKALEFFMNVQTLFLEGCRFDTNIGFIGCLRKLKILSFYCCEIDVLPSEIGQLNNLKLLDLRESKLGSIVPGVLSCLKKLEDLYMGKYFHVKEVEEHNQEKRASITELMSLSTSLKTLQFYVSGDNDLLKLKDFSFHKLKRFDISTGRFYYCSGRYEFLGVLKLEKANLNLFQEAEFAGVLRRAEVIVFDRVYGQKSIMKEADEDGFMNIKKLKIEHNEDMVEICEGNFPSGSMGMLEELELRHLHAMRHLWRGCAEPPSLGNLKVVVVWFCHEIVNLFSSSAARCLVQLQKLRVEHCKMLEEIVSKDGSEYENDTNMIEFLQLKVMKIVDLPSFKSLVAVGYNNNSRSIFNEALLPSMETLSLNAAHVVKLMDGKTNPASFNKLQRVNVRKCHSMEVMFDLEEIHVLDEIGAKVMVFGQLQILNIYDLPELKHIWKNASKERLQGFQNLKTLHLDRCYKIEYLLSVSMAKLVVNLEQIQLYHCQQMEQVIKMDDDEEEGITKETDKIVFPQLRWLIFTNVGLKVFCQGNHHLEFPELEKVTIVQCPNMNNFCSGSLCMPKLRSVATKHGNDCKLIWKGDLNKTVQFLYERSKKDVKEEEIEE